jgi:hypothetical protein
VLAALLLLAGCGGGGALLADGGIIGTGSIIGAVPGTAIEAYGEQGEYFRTFSISDTTGEHPFELQLPAGVGFYLVMIMNEGTDDEIVMPIAFQGQFRNEVLARIVLRVGQVIDLGYIPLYMNCNEIPVDNDPDFDCILETPFLLDESVGANNPLKQMDVDEDGIDDYEDDDHGYGQHSGQEYNDRQDHDGDRIPNFYDMDFNPDPNDQDEDGIDDDEDENPGNYDDDEYDNRNKLNWNRQAMHPLGHAWIYGHEDYAEDNVRSCASCHGADFTGTAASGQVGCYDCHNGPDPEHDDD